MYYNIKVYDIGLNYKSTVSPKVLKTQVKFTSNINWGQGRLTIELNLPINDTTFDLGDIVKVNAFSDENKTGTLIYTGVVQDLQRWGTTNYESIVLECVGIATLLTNVLTGSSYQPNQEPRLTIIDLVNYLNAKYPWMITSYTIPTFGSSRAFNLQHIWLNNALQTVCDTCWWYRYLWQDGVLFVWVAPVSPTHSLTYKKNIEYIRITETRQDIVNDVVVANFDSTLFWLASDATSQTDYGYIKKYIVQSWLVFQNSVDDYAANYIAKNKDPKRDMEIKVNQVYDILSINPWDTIKVRNLTYPITNAQIVRTSFDWVSIVLYVERYISVATEIASLANQTN